MKIYGLIWAWGLRNKVEPSSVLVAGPSLIRDLIYAWTYSTELL